MKRCALLLVFLCADQAAHAFLEHGAKTYFALPHFDTQRCQQHALWHTHITTDVGNPLGFSVQLTPFMNKGVRLESIAEHLTSKQSQTIAIASDRFNQQSNTYLPYHAIVHNPDLDAVESSAQMQLLPSFSNVGTHFDVFFDARQALPGLAFTAHMPLYYATATLHQTGATKTIENYFLGSFSQTDPVQAALAYGRIGQSRHLVAGPLSLALRYSLIENRYNYLVFQLGAGITIKRKPSHVLLFDYHSTVYDHHKIIAGLEAGATVLDRDGLLVDIMVQTNYHYAFKGTENRILGVFDDDGSVPAYSSYLLSGTEGTAGVFPLANVLHRSVVRSGVNQADVAFMAALSWQGCSASFGYELFCKEQERLTVESWPSNTYAIASPMYDTASAFTNAASTGALDETHTILLSHRLLTTNMLNTETATNPAQVGCSLNGSFGCNTMLYQFPVGFGIGVSYTHGFNNATASFLGCWIKCIASF